jgi:hypothetical protein
VPAPHATEDAVPPAQYVPTLQDEHVGGDVDVPGAVCTVPAAHAVCARHDDWSGSAVYVPGPHAVQTRSTLAEGELLTYVPDAHDCHVAHDDWLLLAVNCPLAQPAHVRSCIALPACVTY